METKTIKTDGEPIKILTKKDTSSEVSVENIPGVNIEQLYVGQEVKKSVEIRGEFNTNDASLTRVNNFYNLNLPDPENEIFSFAIDGIDMTFGVGNFGGNPTLAYETVETQLQDKLGDMYTVEYVGSGNYTIVKEFERTISFAEKNLVRNIEFTGWNEHTKVDVIIDGQTISIDGQTHPDIFSAIDFIISQLSTSVYYTKRDGANNLVIARIDTLIPIVTQTDYDRYTYRLSYLYSDLPGAGQVLDFTDTTIDSDVFRYTGTQSSQAFRADMIISNLDGIRTETSSGASSDSLFTAGTWIGIEILNKTEGAIITNVTAQDIADTTLMRLTNEAGTVLETQTAVSGVVNFTTSLSANTTYRVETQTNDDRFSSVTISGDNDTFQITGGSLNGSDTTFVYNVDSITIDGELFDLGVYDYTLSVNGFGVDSYIDIRRIDYSTMTISSLNTYTNTSTFPSDSQYTTITSDTNNVILNITTYTEITSTFTLGGNNFFIRVDMMPTTIEIGAYSSVGTSIGRYEKGEQSTTLGDGSATVQGRVFQTDASNYGTIIKLVKGGFIINFTTTVGNIINYTCR